MRPAAAALPPPDRFYLFPSSARSEAVGSI